jgi:hypothetical protein
MKDMAENVKPLDNHSRIPVSDLYEKSRERTEGKRKEDLIKERIQKIFPESRLYLLLQDTKEKLDQKSFPREKLPHAKK